jgi:protein O-mannosyl-transferase
MTKKSTPSKNNFLPRRDILVSLLLTFSTLIVYWQLTGYDFVNYDDIYIYNNPHVQFGFSKENIVWAFTTNFGSYWHPLPWLSHMLDYQIFGNNPGWHHLTSVILHIANTLLLFFFLKKTTNRLWQSAFVAALFALHPLHVESVAWITERKDVLSTFFWMLTMWRYTSYTKRPTIGNYLLVFVFFALGLMSKPMLVTLPCVLLLLDFYPLKRFHAVFEAKTKSIKAGLFRLLLEKAPLFFLAALSSVVTISDHKSIGALLTGDAIPFQVRISNALVSYAYYLFKMIYPANLAVMYPHTGVVSMWHVAGACLLLLLISVAAIKYAKQAPYFLFGWLWYLGTLVPVIGLVQVGNQAMADRFTYIPLIGIFIIVAWGASDYLKKLRCPSWIQILATTAVIFACMATTSSQAAHWKDSISLYRHTLAVTTNNSVPHNNLGLALAKNGQADEAIAQYKKALSTNPDYEKAHYNLAISFAAKGQVVDAITHYTQALRINPDFVEAHNNLGLCYKDLGQPDNAILHYKEALRINPDYSYSHYNLAVSLYKKGDIDRSIYHFKKAIELKPDFSSAITNLKVALRRKNNHP